MSAPAPAGPPRSGRTRGEWILRDRPAVAWLVLALVVLIAHPWLASSTWLAVHLVLLGALTHSIIVWSAHFTRALLKSPDAGGSRAEQDRRLLTLVAGTTLVLVGVPTTWWWVAVSGATLVCVAVLWHVVRIVTALRRALSGRFRVTMRAYVVAGLWVPVGATFGVLLARGPLDEWRGRLLVAHTMTMLLGWVGITLVATLVTLWPTLLRTRIDERAERHATHAIPGLAVALAVVDGGALWGTRWMVLVGLVGYVGCLLWWGRSLLGPLRAAPPQHFAPVSVGCGLLWFLVALGLVGRLTATATSWGDLADSYTPVAAVAAIGVAGQLLAGALSALVPAALGGGSRIVRAGIVHFDRWAAARLVLVNVGLAVAVLPVPAGVEVVAGGLAVLGLASFVPLMFAAIHAMVAARTEGLSEPRRQVVSLGPEPIAWRPGQASAALAAVALAVATGLAVTPSLSVGAGGPAGDAVVATGHTTQVAVTAADMRFSPSTISVPVGDRLVVILTNTDPSTTHDLVMADGARTPRLSPGQSATLDVGVIGADTRGWCDVVGHAQMGMNLTVTVTGTPSAGATSATATSGAANTGGVAAASGPPAGLDLHGSYAPAGQDAFTPAPVILPPVGPGTRHEVTLHITEVPLQVAPGVWQTRWTYNGSVPGPVLHGHLGDTFVVTLVNDGSMGHSIDFHAGEVAPDGPMRTIPPGGSLVYTFTATRAGIWLYHCSTMPMSAHIAAGMFGAVVIDPPGLAPVEQSYVLVQSEDWLGGSDTRSTPSTIDAARATAGTPPDVVTFNGSAFQYDQSPLTASAGKRIRIWVLDAGPNGSTSFHVVGTQFDTVYAEGSYLLRGGSGGDAGAGNGGSQVLGLQAAQGGFVELTPPAPGHYAVLDHAMANAEKGAHATLLVSP